MSFMRAERSSAIAGRLAGKKAAIAIVTLCFVNAYLLSQTLTANRTITNLQAQIDGTARSLQTQITDNLKSQVDAQRQSTLQNEMSFEDFKSKLQRQPARDQSQFVSAVQESTILPVSKASSTNMLRPLGGPNGLTDRLSRLETIVKGRLNWIKEPYIGHRVTHKCQNQEKLDEHYICHDDFPPPGALYDKFTGQASTSKSSCVVYDFGIREQPGFGKTIAERFPECEVHAFDPSPIAVAFQESNKEDAQALRQLKNYHFHPYGAGGVDGQITLYDYNWGQVSSIRVPFYVTNDCGYGEEADLADPNIKKDPSLKYHERRCRTADNMAESEGVRGGFGTKQHQLEVRTLKTIMADLGHTHVDVLKLDVEGSEFAFLESALDDFDCPPVEQMSIEWHHYNFDTRYGGGASPEVNAIATYLHDRCATKQYQVTYDNGGWEDNFEWLKDAYLSLRFNTGSYIRVR